MWPYTIFWDSYAFFCKSSINKCLLMLNPLSIALSPRDNTNFWFSCKYALRTLSMRTSVLPNISNLPQFSNNSVTKDFWYYCLALSTSFADSHSICSIFHLDFRISVLIRLFRTILLGDKDGAFLTIKYFSGHLSCSFSNTDTAILHSISNAFVVYNQESLTSASIPFQTLFRLIFKHPLWLRSVQL